MKEFYFIRNNEDLVDLKRLGFDSEFDWDRQLQLSQIIGVRSDDRWVGLIGFRHLDGFTRVELIEVANEYRSRNYGAMLLATVMEEAFKRPGNGGYVELTPKTNGAQNFYLHLGAFYNRHVMIFDPFHSLVVINKYLKKA